jgi:hypothetical protein
MAEGETFTSGEFSKGDMEMRSKDQMKAKLLLWLGFSLKSIVLYQRKQGCAKSIFHGIEGSCRVMIIDNDLCPCSRSKTRLGALQSEFHADARLRKMYARHTASPSRSVLPFDCCHRPKPPPKDAVSIPREDCSLERGRQILPLSAAVTR